MPQISKRTSDPSVSPRGIFDRHAYNEIDDCVHHTAIESCALITLEGNDLMKRIHNTGANPFRMPALLAREDREAWLTGTLDQAKATLRGYPQECMVAYQVSTRVNTPKNNDPSLIEPVS